jgi:predicted dehydrogenase
MSDRILRVGIIGVNPKRGWAREAHVPAVQGVEGLELLAVATRGQEKAEAAAAASGAQRAYGEASDLIADVDVDIVTVAAPVPSHRALIQAALTAGKHVVTEWPVGVDTAETEAIAAVAQSSGSASLVSLQARFSPAVRKARELIGTGAIGRITTVSVYSTTAGFGPDVTDGELDLEQPESGMNLPRIQLAHTIDIAAMLAGPVVSLASLETIQFPELAVGERRRPRTRTIADHVLVQGRLHGGGAMNLEVRGGVPAEDTPFVLAVRGDRGDLVLRGGAARGFQSGSLELSTGGETIPVSSPETVGLPDPAVNVALGYVELRERLGGRPSDAPDFFHAVALSRLVDAVRTSDQVGRRLMLTD